MAKNTPIVARTAWKTMPSHRTSNAFEITPRKTPSVSAYSGARMGAAFGRKTQTMASAKAPNSAIQDQPGMLTWLVVLEISVCDQPTTPPAMTSRNSANVRAKAPLAVMWATRVVGGAPVASACASSTGAAQPASSSFWIASKRFSFSVGLAMISLSPLGGCVDPAYGTLRRRRARSRRSARPTHDLLPNWAV